MFFLDLLITLPFFFLWPALAIPRFNEKWKKRFSALILVNFVIMFAIFYWASLYENIMFLGDVVPPIIWSFVAYFFLKNKFKLNPAVESVADPADTPKEE